MLGVKRHEVRLAPHNDAWERLYQETKAEVRHILGTNAIEIQHIGSTAIRGIVAKPILDVAVIVHDREAIHVDEMQRNGYVHKGEAGIPGRCFFVKYQDTDCSTHHIHCYEPNHPNLLANIAFRDYLIAHPDYARQYNDLKLRLAQQHPTDRVAYTDEKTDFIRMILQLAQPSP